MRRKKEVNEGKKETRDVFRQLGSVGGLFSNHGSELVFVNTWFSYIRIMR